MAKKLLVGTYTFDASERLVKVSGNLAAEKFLLITNITDNKIIYNFADATLGFASKSYSVTDDKTSFTLKYDTSSMSDTDVLQIFTDNDYTEITPSEDLIDPVGKMRISNPQNLIDTDFEYGLQGTKWETLQVINNIPTIYSNAGDKPVDGITAANVVAGSRAVQVQTSLAHGLNIGDPISVQGMSDYQSEGYFIVTAVPSTTEFFYEPDVAASTTGDISGSYTTIVAGKFYEGSTLPVNESSGATTDGTDQSTINVATTETNGFATGTKVYLRNTIGPKTLVIANSTATAPDGRPFVDVTENFITNTSVNTAATTSRGSFRYGPVVTYDWVSTYNKYFPLQENGAANADWATGGTNNITWTNHQFQDKFTLLFNCPYIDKTDGGATDGTVYYVKVIDDNTISLYNDLALSSQVTLSALENKFGPCRLGLVYKVESSSGTTRKTAFNVATESASQANTTQLINMGTSITTKTETVDVTAVFGGNPTSVTIDKVYLAGDVNSSFEWVQLAFGDIAATQFYSPGNQSANFGSINVTTFDNYDISPYLTTDAGGNTVFSITHTCSPQVGYWLWGYGSGLSRYRLMFQLSQAVTPSYSNTDLQNSGSDFVNNTWGLGSQQPTALIAFQGRTGTSGSATGSYSTSSEAFSYLQNQRNRGRFGTIKNQYNTLALATDNLGKFTIDYTQGTWSGGTGSEVFYMFGSTINSDRNTVYIPDHGIDDGQQVSLNIGADSISNSEYFAYASGSGTVTEYAQASIAATVAKVNKDVIRLTTDTAPNTDDMVKVPSQFYIAFTKNNPNYNTIYVADHKITGNAQAEYVLGSGSVIPPLVDSTTYTLQRVSDSRLTTSAGGGGGGGAPSTGNTADWGTSSWGTFNQFIDVQTPLGINPGSLTIKEVWYRGDFSWSGEYMDLSFDDGTTFRIGQYGGQDSASWVRETGTWTTDKIMDTLLVTNGGVKGFNATMVVNNQVNYSPGNFGAYWQVRFVVEGLESTIVLTGAGSGDHRFNVIGLVGAYDGVLNINNLIDNKQFQLGASFQIPKRNYEFTNTEVDAGTDVISFTNDHNFLTGEKVEYNSQLNASILPAGASNTVYVIAASANTIKLASSEVDARANLGLDISSQTGTHVLQSQGVIKAVPGPGTIQIATDSNIIYGTGTKFLSNFKRYDKIFINNGTFIEEYIVNLITTNEDMTIFSPSTGTVAAADYYYSTQFALRPDGFSLHMPFDGGVDMTAGTSPNSKITRQTRKYFRYQSGKGIQTSFAINFNPPKPVSDLIKANGAIATVNTQEQHNLNVGDGITVMDAEVQPGQPNLYNGDFAVQSVPDAFTFTYEMSGSPGDVKAAGFPKYVRDSWTDAFVRAGMFDDQNGFFFEFDGQKIYAVRRSSTTQFAGTVSATKNSQVITGKNTAFTTQCITGDSIVIRGQTYRVVEVSSDIRLVVQPAYRGVTASAVKCTKVIDTRTPQENWNIDPADGTGFTGFILDTKKIQMAYMDYSWYGAGKIRYGFKDAKGHIRYFHEYRHNNLLTESYFRSGNLPARYEIENGTNATTAPTLFHFGTSVIMDGTFDDDKAYQFTGESRPVAYTQGTSRSFTSGGGSTFSQITLNGERVWVYTIPVNQESIATATTIGETITHTSATANTSLPVGSFVTQVKADGSNSLIYLNYPATSSQPDGTTTYVNIPGSTTFVAGEQSTANNSNLQNPPVDLTQPLPLVSVRLAPSVDSSLTGALGEREVINRMQLKLMTASITVNQDAELLLISNPLPSDQTFLKAQSPSLSEVLRHKTSDTLLNGTTIYSTKVSAGSLTLDISALMEMGNSILGGDGVFPTGPDLLTLAVQPQDTSGVKENAPFFASGKISWSESQA